MALDVLDMDTACGHPCAGAAEQSSLQSRRGQRKLYAVLDTVVCIPNFPDGVCV